MPAPSPSVPDIFVDLQQHLVVLEVRVPPAVGVGVEWLWGENQLLGLGARGPQRQVAVCRPEPGPHTNDLISSPAAAEIAFKERPPPPHKSHSNPTAECHALLSALRASLPGRAPLGLPAALALECRVQRVLTRGVLTE